MAVLEPSEWARERFGEAAAALQQVVPLAIRKAHERAVAAHVASELKTNDAYGSTLVVAQHEELVEYTKDIPGVAARRPVAVLYRFELVVVDEAAVVLCPWRYATDSSTRREAARMRRPVSEFRKTLLTLVAQRADRQLTLDQAGLDFEELEAQIREEQVVLEQLARFGQVVTIGYASHPLGGIFTLGWGDVELVDDDTGAVYWHHWEPLSAADSDAEMGDVGTPTPPLRPVGGPGGGRFDDAPLNDDLGLTPRAPLSGEPSSEPERRQPETGSDDTPE